MMDHPFPRPSVTPDLPESDTGVLRLDQVSSVLEDEPSTLQVTVRPGVP